MDENKNAIEAIEKKIAELKHREEYYHKVNLDLYDELHEKTKKEANELYDKFISDPKRANQKEL